MSIAKLIKEIEIFQGLSSRQIDMIATICNEKHYAADQIIFEENTRGDELYVIIKGEVDIQLDPALLGKPANGPQTVATLTRGQSFGEVALVDDGLRSARAKSASNTVILVIKHQTLMQLCASYPELGFIIMRNLAADLAMKLRNTDIRMRELLRNQPTS